MDLRSGVNSHIFHYFGKITHVIVVAVIFFKSRSVWGFVRAVGRFVLSRRCVMHHWRLMSGILAMVAIMRSIEKEQTLPTVGMMQALFNRELESDGEWEGDFDFFEQQLTEKKTR